MKKTAALLAAAVLLSTTAAFAEVPESYVQGGAGDIVQSIGVCDTDKAFDPSVETVEDYSKGVIAAGFGDMTGDSSPEMVLVERDRVSIYTLGEDGTVMKLWTYLVELAANEGSSYSNVFFKNLPTELDDGTLIYDEHLCIETYSDNSAGRSYKFVILEPRQTDDGLKLTEKAAITRTKTAESETQTVQGSNGVTVYSYTMENGTGTSYGDYENLYTAARRTLFGYGFAEDYFLVCHNRLWFDEPSIPDTTDINETLINKINELNRDENYNVSELVDCAMLSYIKADNIGQSSPAMEIESYAPADELLANAPIMVVVNGQRLTFDQPPVIQDGRTLVPVRAIFEALGAEVAWLGNGGWIAASSGDTIITMQINSNRYYVNGEEKTLDVPAQLINDRTMVPVRAISESLNASVSWDQSTKTVSVTK